MSSVTLSRLTFRHVDLLLHLAELLEVLGLDQVLVSKETFRKVWMEAVLFDELICVILRIVFFRDVSLLSAEFSVRNECVGFSNFDWIASWDERKMVLGVWLMMLPLLLDSWFCSFGLMKQFLCSQSRERTSGDYCCFVALSFWLQGEACNHQHFSTDISLLCLIGSW